MMELAPTRWGSVHYSILCKDRQNIAILSEFIGIIFNQFISDPPSGIFYIYTFHS